MGTGLGTGVTGMSELVVVGAEDYRRVAVRIANSRAIQHGLRARLLRSRQHALGQRRWQQQKADKEGDGRKEDDGENRKGARDGEAKEAVQTDEGRASASVAVWDTLAAVRRLEHAYRTAWEIYSAGEPPKHIRLGLGKAGLKRATTSTSASGTPAGLCGG